MFSDHLRVLEAEKVFLNSLNPLGDQVTSHKSALPLASPNGKNSIVAGLALSI